MEQHNKLHALLLPCLHCKRSCRVSSQGVLGLQVLRLGESTSLRGKAAAAAVLAIAQNGKLHELALPPYLQGLQGVMPDTLQESKDLRHLSLSRIWCVSPFLRGSSGVLCKSMSASIGL